VETALRYGYPRLRAASQELARQGIEFRDISDALARRPPGEEVFLDFCHVADAGNALVADRMMRDYFDALTGR
jgi:hypothetical protein